MRTMITTGIPGFDALAGGGLPRARLVSIFGSAGTGKTIFALQTLAHRMRDHGEHAIFVSFEQPTAHVLADVENFHWGLDELAGDQLTLIDATAPYEAVHNGDFSLDGLTAGLTAVIAEKAATVVVLDGVDAVLSLLQPARQRAELSRLVGWLAGAGVTGIFTVKPGDHREPGASRAEFLEYHTDCVISLGTLEAANAVSRTLRVVKYRGSHSQGESVPLLIAADGITLLAPRAPEIAVASAPSVEDRRYSTGLPDLDAILGGGYRRGSTTLVSGAPGTAKSTLCAAFALDRARAGSSTLYVSFDETPAQIVSHMASVGFDARAAIDADTLAIVSISSGGAPPERHVQRILQTIDERGADAIVIDPISAVMRNDHPFAARIIEFLLGELRQRGITMVCTSLLEGQSTGITESTQSQVSTLADTWIHLSYVAIAGERNRALTIVKSRGTDHSNQVRELLLSDSGVRLNAIYTADGDVLMGTARVQKEAADRKAAILADSEQKDRESRAEDELAELSQRARGLEREMERKQRELQQLHDERERVLASDSDDQRTRLESRGSGATATGPDSESQASE